MVAKKTETAPEAVIYQEPIFEPQEPQERKVIQTQTEKEDEIATAIQKAAAVQKKAAENTNTENSQTEQDFRNFFNQK